MAKPSMVTELAQFITPSIRADVRHTAIAYLVNEAYVNESKEIFIDEDFKITKALVDVFENLRGERVDILTIFTNLTAVSGVISNYLIVHSKLPKILIECVMTSNPWATASSKLLANLSRQFPDKIYEIFKNEWPNFIDEIMNMLLKTKLEECSDYLGCVLLNFSQLKNFRKEITHETLSLFYPLLRQNDKQGRRRLAMDILRNFTFDDDLHGQLLEESDDFLTAILTLIADENYDLDDEEQSKLPIDLQYYEGKRVTDEILIEKIVETLYQLCATKIGRNILRSKGVYPLLREFDKATSDSKATLMLADQENTLHALIGVLIRYEEEMEIPDDLHSIRNLE
uniref:Protein HGH1 homolog n=1 Tax=Parastrongyloides trichosuri TaxID=131310 RepID=A0A0N4ZNE0_PARTI